MPYIGAAPQNRILSSADIAQGAVTLDDISFTDQPTNMDITGTIDKHTMRLADGVTITGDVTISDDLVLSKISDDGNAITMTNDGRSRTITGSGSIEASTLSQTPNQSLTGMTGTIGSAVTNNAGVASGAIASGVTGSPALNLTTTTSFPAGHVLRVFYQTASGDITVTSGTTIVTGLTQTLTPLSNTSKFLISYNCSGRFNSGADTTFQTQVYYGGSAIGGIANANNFSNDTNNPSSLNGSFLHSPATASAITYDIRLALTFGSGSLGLSTGHSHMTIMEIAG